MAPKGRRWQPAPPSPWRRPGPLSVVSPTSCLLGEGRASSFETLYPASAGWLKGSAVLRKLAGRAGGSNVFHTLRY